MMASKFPPISEETGMICSADQAAAFILRAAPTGGRLAGASRGAGASFAGISLPAHFPGLVPAHLKLTASMCSSFSSQPSFSPSPCLLLLLILTPGYFPTGL